MQYAIVTIKGVYIRLPILGIGETPIKGVIYYPNINIRTDQLKRGYERWQENTQTN